MFFKLGHKSGKASFREAAEEALALLAASVPPALSSEAPPGPDQAVAAEDAATPALRLEGQGLRRALFRQLVALFLPTPPDPTDIKLERGKYNRAIKSFEAKGLQPDDLNALKAAFEYLWPKATCTALALANHIPLLSQTARELGYAIGVGSTGVEEAAGSA